MRENEVGVAIWITGKVEFKIKNVKLVREKH